LDDKQIGATTANWQDVSLGAILCALALYFGIDTLVHLPLGTPLRMGPGLYPLILAGCLLIVGLVIGIKGFREQVEAQPMPAVPWRAVILLTPLPVFFGLTIRGLGIIPVIFVMVLVASFVSRDTTVRGALALAAGMTVFCVVVFHYIAGMPNPLLGPWVTGPLGIAPF
jgi:hypothetical protein